jgi:uncharacterized protein YkwD
MKKPVQALVVGVLLALACPGCHQQREDHLSTVKILTHADLGIRLTPAERTKETSRFLVLLNRYRRQKGLGPLAADRVLQTTAQWMSEDMAGHDYAGHTDSYGRDPFQRLAAFGYTNNTYKAENVAAGHATAEEAFQSWRESPTHNDNMLSPHFKFIGVGFTYQRKSRFGWYWATSFGGEKSSTAK